MKEFKRGTPAYGAALGALFVVIGALLLTIGFWKTLLLAALFALGFFLGTVNNKGEFLREAANRVIPQKQPSVIDFRQEVAREQEQQAERPEEQPEEQNAVREEEE